MLDCESRVKPPGLTSLRVLETKWFAKAAAKALITERMLCDAIAAVTKGQADDLGGGVWKKRLGKNEYRSIILAKSTHFWIYTFLFAKADRANIDGKELAGFRKLAREFETLTDAKVDALMKSEGWREICNAKV